MQSTFALMLRSLRVDSRHRRWHLMRFGLVAILLWLLWVTQWNVTPASAPGRIFFGWLVWTDAVLLFVAGPIIFGTSITEEKEERTLQLLKIANVGPLSILAGKVIPLLLSVILVLVIQYPLTLLAITLGGVAMNQVGAAFVSLLAFLFFVAMLSTLCSVIFRTSGAAIGVSLAVSVILLVLPWLGVSILSVLRTELQIPQLLSTWDAYLARWAQVNVFLRAQEVLQSGFDAIWIDTQVIGHLLAGGLCFGLAWLVFEPCNAVLEEGVPERRVKKKLEVAEGAGGTTRLLPRRRCWNAALMWRDFFYLVGGHRMILLKVLGYGALIILFAMLQQFQGMPMDLEVLGGMLVFFAAIWVIPLELSVLVGRTFRAEIKEKTLTTLLMLPRSTREIAYGKLAGSLLSVLPALGYLLLGFMLAPRTVEWIFEGFNDEPLPMLGGTAMFLTHGLLFLHLTSYFSVLSNTWIGILGAGLTQWFGTMTIYLTVLMFFFGLLQFRGDAAEMLGGTLVFLAILANFGLITVIHIAIGRALERKAAES